MAQVHIFISGNVQIMTLQIPNRNPKFFKKIFKSGLETKKHFKAYSLAIEYRPSLHRCAEPRRLNTSLARPLRTTLAKFPSHLIVWTLPQETTNS